MAYLRKDEETVEIGHTLAKVWTAVHKATESLGWELQETNEAEHRVKVKSKAGPMSWSSVLLIDVTHVDENTSRVLVRAETPITMIVAIIDFAQGRRRIGQFLEELAKQLAD